MNFLAGKYERQKLMRKQAPIVGIVACMSDCEDKDAVLLHNGSMGMQGFMLGSSGMQAGVFKAES